MKSTLEKYYTDKGNLDVLSLIPNDATYILDVGCGSGSNSSLIKEKIDCIIDGITLSGTEAKEASRFMRQVFVHNLENGLPESLKTEKLYDVVICSHVLEHICYPNSLLNDIKNVLNDKGILIVALPNIMHYKSRFELLKGNFNYLESGVWDYTHFRWYTFKTGHDLLTNSGFVVVKSYVSGDLPLLTITRILTVSIRQKIFALLSKISKGFFGGQLLYVAQKL